jgi:hypothetical protein
MPAMHERNSLLTLSIHFTSTLPKYLPKAVEHAEIHIPLGAAAGKTGQQGEKYEHSTYYLIIA